MRIRHIAILAGSLFLGIPAVGALADYVYTDTNGTHTVFSFVCQTTKLCTGFVLMDSTGTEKATSGNPVRIDPVGTTTQPVTCVSGCIGGGGANAAASATATAVPTAADYQGLNIGSNLQGWTGVNPSGSIFAGQIDLTSIGGTTVLKGAGATGNGSQRTTVAQDTTTVAGSAPGTAGAASTNVVTVQGVASMTPVQVSQATAASLNATVVGTGTFTTQVNGFTSWAGSTLGAIANYGTSPGAVLVPGVNAFVTNANANGSAVPGSSAPVTLPILSHASVTSLGTSLVAKASAGDLHGFNCTAITGGAAGFCIAYNATAAPGTGALTGSLVLDSCFFDTTARGCALTHVNGSIAFSTGIVILVTSAVTPFTYTTGTDTAFVSADYQ